MDLQPITLISRTMGGTPAGVVRFAAPGISGDGSVVAFRSNAPDIVANDTNGAFDVFVNDLTAGAITRVSIGSDGTQTEETRGTAFGDLDLSSDGQIVAFDAKANDLDPRAFANHVNVFVHDRESGETSLVSLNDSTNLQPAQPDVESIDPAISGNGLLVVYESDAPLLGQPQEGVLDIDDDVWLRDRDAGEGRRLSVSTDGADENGTSGDADISAAGNVVAFGGIASNLTDTPLPIGGQQIYIVDVADGSIELASRGLDGGYGDDDSFNVSVSGTGRHVAFQSRATNLVTDDTNGVSDIFVLDRATGVIERVNLRADGSESSVGGGGGGTSPSISGTGRYVTFLSDKSDLVSGDTNGDTDVFVVDRRSGEVARVNVSASGEEADTSGSVASTTFGTHFVPVISEDGRYIAFVSAATNLIDGQTLDGTFEVYRAPNPLYEDTSAAASLTGTAAGEALDGEAGDDALNGLAGDDFLAAAAGNDTIDGGDGNDRAYGQSGNDSIIGGAGNDSLFGNLGSDTIFGGTGDDSLKAQTDDDLIQGDGGNDVAFGGGNDDVIDGGADSDTLNGNSGFDTIFGGTGDDTLRGQGGRDSLDGGDGDDLLLGMQGFDTLIGGAGNDTLIGGPANDVLTGGSGIDTFTFGAGQGSNTITDFADGTDLILFQGFTFADINIANSGGNAVITVDGDDVAVTVNGINASQINTADLVFG